MQTPTKNCKYQVTTTLNMSIGYLLVFKVTSNEIRHKRANFYLQIFTSV